MNSMERIRAAFEHRTPDRTPNFEYVLLRPICDYILGRPFQSYDDDAAKWRAWALEEGYDRAVRRYARERVEIARKLGHDMMYVLPAPAPEAPVDEEVEWPDTEEERVDLCSSIRARKLAKGIDTRGFIVYDYLKQEMERAGCELEIFVPAYTLGIWTNTELMMTMMTEPEIAHRHFEVAGNEAVAYIDAYAQFGIRLMGVGGDFAGNRLLISPEAYRTFIVPEVRRVAERVHEKGGWAITASDGDLRSVLDDCLIATNVDGYMEIDQRAGMDMAMLKKGYGDRICLMGNIDCGSLMSFGTPEEIRRAVFKCLDEGWGNGGHIFTCSNAISASIPFENYQALNNAYRDYFGLARTNW